MSELDVFAAGAVTPEGKAWRAHALEFARALDEVTAERDLLAEMLPPLTPDFAKLMERLDFQTSQLDRTVSEYPDLLRLIQSARHALRYASDGEQGNAVMRNRLDAAEAALEAKDGELARQAEQSDGLYAAVKLLSAERDEQRTTVTLYEAGYDSIVRLLGLPADATRDDVDTAVAALTPSTPPDLREADND